MSTKHEEQPHPAAGEGDVWREVIDNAPDDITPETLAMCEARRALGIARYGQPLQRGDGRDHRRDLVEELLDGAAYAQSVGLSALAVDLLRLAQDVNGGSSV